MKDYKKTIWISIICIILLVLIVIGVTYAYFSAQADINGGVDVNATTTDAIEVEFDGNDNLSLLKAEPGDSDEVIFTVKLTASNKTKDTVNYSIDWLITKNEFVYEPDSPGLAQLVYSLYHSTDGVGWTPLIENADCTELGTSATVDNPTNKNLVSNHELTADINTTETDYWKFKVEYRSYDFNQATNMNKSFNGSIKVSEF